MADPVTILTVVGTVVGAVSSFSQGQAAGAAADRDAALRERNALVIAERAKFEEDRLRERGERLRGRQRAAAGAQGTTLEGSASLLAAELAQDIELDALAIRFSATEAAIRERAAAANSRLDATAARTAGVVGAFSSILTGAADLSDVFGDPETEDD